MIEYMGRSRQELDRMVEDDRNAIENLFGREVVAYTESIKVHINPDKTPTRTFYGGYAWFDTREGHVVKASFANCLKRVGAIPRELKACKELRDLSFYDTASFMFLVDLSQCLSLERLEIRQGPIVDVGTIGMNINLRELVIRDSFKLTFDRGLHGVPYLQRMDLSYNRLEEIPDMAELRRLEELDLSHNQIASYENLKNPGSLKRVDLRGNGFWRGLRNYSANRRIVKGLRQQGVEVAG